MAVIPKTKFVDIDFIKEVTPIQDNVDDNLLIPFIFIAQDVHIQKVLGESFYNHLKIAGADETLTTVETDLLQNFIITPLAFWTYYEALPSIKIKATNKSVSKESSEFSQPVELDEIKYNRADTRNVAEYYEAILIEHLIRNSELYPLYLNPDPEENIRRKTKKFFNGVYIPKTSLGKHFDGVDIQTRDIHDCPGC